MDRLTLACSVLVLQMTLAIARADVTFTNDFMAEATNVTAAGTALVWGNGGWFTPAYFGDGFLDLAQALVADTNLAVAGMNGAILRLNWDVGGYGCALRLLPPAATNLAAFDMVQMEVTLCQTNTLYGGGLFLVRTTHFVTEEFYGPRTYLNYASDAADWFGVQYDWFSPAPCVTVTRPSLRAAGVVVATPNNADLEMNKTYRIRVSFDLAQNRMGLEHKTFDSVSGTWGQWATDVAWVSAGCDLRAAGLNAMDLYAHSGYMPPIPNVYLDDFSFSAISTNNLAPLPIGFAAQVEGGWLPELCAPTNTSARPSASLPGWAQPRDGKRLRALFICNSANQYEPLMVARAFDLECDIIPMWVWYSWRENGLDPATMNLLRYYLGTRHYDVIAMTSAWLSALPDDCEREIADLVQNQGVGFVYALPGIAPRLPEWQGQPSPILDPLLPIVLNTNGYAETSGYVRPADPHPLSRGVDFGCIQWYCNSDAAIVTGATAVLCSELTNRVLAAAVTRGQGRVVAYNRCYNENVAGYQFLPVVDCLTNDETQTGKHCRWLGEKDSAFQFYNWFGRALTWAAQADPVVNIQTVTVSTVAQTVTVSLTNTTAHSEDLRVRTVVHSPFDTIVLTNLEPIVTVPAGTASVQTCALTNTGYQGMHKLDVVLVSTQGMVIDWNSSVYQVTNACQVALTPDFTLYATNDTVTVSLQVGGLTGGMPFSLRTELFDLDGRLLTDRQRNDVLGTGQTLITDVIDLAPTRIATALANLRVTLCAGGVATEVRDQWFVRQAPQWSQFHIMPYGGCDYNLVCSDAMIETLKQSGHDTILYAYANPLGARINTETGLRCEVGHVSDSSGYDPQQIQAQVSWLRKFSPVVYEQQDEPELQFTPAAEARFDDPANMGRFYSWLEARYDTVAALNASWGADYTAWTDAQRVLWYEMVDTTNWAAWFDSRRDLDDYMVDIFDQCGQAIQAVETNAFCPINPRSVDTFGGINLGEFTRRLRAGSLYNSMCSAFPMGYLELGAQWVDFAQSVGGYSWPSNPNTNGLAHEAWDTLRHGVNQLAWFAPFCDEMPPQARFSYLNGDYTLNAKGQAIAQINHKLLAGPGDVAVNTAPLDEGVFIYYPRTLTYANSLAFLKQKWDANPMQDPATLTGLGPWMEQLPNSFVQPMRALGFQFQFGDEQDLTAERLQNMRVVFLSHVVCLGEAELELLLDFVNAGGCVVAEGGTARRDADGRLYEETPQPFRALFGVERVTPIPSPVVGPDSVVPCGAGVVSGIAPELGVAYSNGNGRAFFLDFVLPSTNNITERNQAVKRIMDLAGIQPTYALSRTAAPDSVNPSIFVRTLGDLTWLFVVGEAWAGDLGYTIALPAQQQVYDLTGGTNLGTRSTIEGQIAYGEARVFALSPVPAVTLTVAPAAATHRPGDRVQIDCALTSTNERLFRVECTGPQGSPLPSLPRLLRAPMSQASFAFFIPLNAAPGLLELTIIDLASGTKGCSRITCTNGVVATPTFSPAADTYTNAQPVTIGAATGGATIRYTTNGSTPSRTNGTVYIGPVTIASNTTLKALAYKSGMSDSAVASGSYVILLPCATPTFTPGAGTYTNSRPVTISSATGGATIRYTTNGSMPSQTNGTVYAGAVTVSSNMTLKALAYKSGMSDSAVASAAYTIVGLPSPWVTQDIGTVGKVGSATYSAGTFTLQGAGTNIAGTADAFRYAQQTSSGDCEIKVRVTSVSNTSSRAKVGVMIRESLNANAREAGVWVTPSSGIVFTYRSSTGGNTSTNTSSGKTAPYWVRLTRGTNSFRAYYGANGTNWTQLGSTCTIAMATNATLGLGTCSGNTNALCTGNMDNVTVTP